MSRPIVRLLVALTVLVVGAGIALPAQAQTLSRPQNHRSFTLAERQLLLIERMTNSVLLAALGIDASPSLNAVISSLVISSFALPEKNR